MAFMQNLSTFTAIQARLDANTNRLTQAKNTIDQAVADLVRIETDMAAAIAVIDADVAESATSSDPTQQALAGVTMAAKVSVFGARDLLLAKAKTQQKALAAAQ